MRMGQQVLGGCECVKSENKCWGERKRERVLGSVCVERESESVRAHTRWGNFKQRNAYVHSNEEIFESTQTKIFAFYLFSSVF